jgi:DNA-binding YbaB/EbfC family protein
MLKGLANLATFVKQAQQVSGKMQEVTAQLKAKQVKGTAGGGLIVVEANGLGEVLRVRIDPSLLDREMLEDLLPAAFNQASEKAKQLHMEMMQSLTSGFDIPGLDEAFTQITGGVPKS